MRVERPTSGQLAESEGAPPEPAPLPASESLDRLLDLVLRRLDRIEELAADQISLAERDPSDRERELRERVRVLEASQARLQAEVKRREQEWQELHERIEEDRRLLADSWERLERDRLELATTPAVSAAPGARQVPVAPGHAAQQPVYTAPPTPADDPVARDILWQFQALKRDVRQSAKGAPSR